MFPESKLDRANLDVEMTDPFFIFEIEGLFPASVFDALDGEFPGADFFRSSHENRGGKSYLINRAPLFFEFLEQAPNWRKLYDDFTSDTLISRLWEMSRAVASERPRPQTLPWRLASDPYYPGRPRSLKKILARIKGRLGRYTPVQIGFEMSRLEGGCYIPPHTDVIKKLISLMIYFPDAGAQYDETAGTEFYRGRDEGEAWKAWKSGMLADDDAQAFYAAHERFYVSPFTANKLVGFIKSSNSWHGVRPVNLPPGAFRRSVNINYFLV